MLSFVFICNGTFPKQRVCASNVSTVNKVPVDMIVVVNKSEAGIKVIHVFFFLQISDNFTKNIKNKSHKLSKFINTTAVINVVKHIYVFIC